MKEKIVVFDVLGPAYHYDQKGWISGAVEPLLERLKKYGYTGKTDVEEAQDEESMIKSGKETPLIMPGFVETVLYLQKERIRPVVVSAGTPWVLEYCIDRAAQDYTDRTGTVIRPEQLVQSADLVSTVGMGSKKKMETWTKAVEGYGGVEVRAVYEDTFANLTASMEGLNPTRGYHVTSTKFGLARLEHDPMIVRGHMEELLKHIGG